MHASLAEESLPSLTLHSLSVQNPCFERMSLTLPSKSLQDTSLTLRSYSLTKDVESLTLQNLSFQSASWILQSLSLIDANGLQRISFKEVSLDNGSLKETEEILADKLAEGGAETNSFPQHSFAKDQLAAKEDGTNIFSQSFLDGILSLRKCLRIFVLSSFQLTCAALILGTCYLSGSFPKESLQSQELVAAYSRESFEQSPMRASQQDSFREKKLYNKSLDSNQLCRTQLCNSTLGRFQLDLVPSLSLPWFSQTSSRSQLQPDSFDNSSFKHGALPCAALLSTKKSSLQLQNRSGQSFQPSEWQLCLGMVQGGASHRTSQQQPALQERSLSTALTLTSLSLAPDAWLKPSGKKAWRRRALRTRSSSRSLPTSAWQLTTYLTAFTTTSTRTSTRSSTRTLLSMFLLSFVFNNFFFSNSFESCPLGLFHDHLGQENHCLDQLQYHSFIEKNKKKEKKQHLSEAVPDRELAQLHLSQDHHYQLHLLDQPFSGTKQLPEEQSFTSCLLRQMISSFKEEA